MAVTQAIPITRHPYADGSYKKMLIDGKWVDAASGKRFEMPAQVARRWLTRGAAATVHRVDQQQAEQKQGSGAS